ncbi:MAG: hypothetical protein K6C99_05840 [Lachnospiraceae bacterium]|nr:hypothetical protein [Lachnospiraceae bacterium]
MKNSILPYICLISLTVCGCGSDITSRPAANNTNTIEGVVAALSGNSAASATDGVTDAAWDYYPEADTASAVSGDASVSQDAWAYIDPEEFPTGDVIDLTQMSANMVYATVLDMFTVPSEYEGKTIIMDGTFSLFSNEQTGTLYYACIIKDATACCSQGMEFLLKGNAKYPDDYPEVGDYVKVTGTFELYEEDGLTYCHLANAVMDETIPQGDSAQTP